MFVRGKIQKADESCNRPTFQSPLMGLGPLKPLHSGSPNVVEALVGCCSLTFTPSSCSRLVSLAMTP